MSIESLIISNIQKFLIKIFCLHENAYQLPKTCLHYILFLTYIFLSILLWSKIMEFFLLNIINELYNTKLKEMEIEYSYSMGLTKSKTCSSINPPFPRMGIVIGKVGNDHGSAPVMSNPNLKFVGVFPITK